MRLRLPRAQGPASRSRNTRCWILPVAVRGISHSGTECTRRGRLKPAMRAAAFMAARLRRAAAAAGPGRAREGRVR